MLNREVFFGKRTKVDQGFEGEAVQNFLVCPASLSEIARAIKLTPPDLSALCGGVSAKVAKIAYSLKIQHPMSFPLFSGKPRRDNNRF